MPQIAVAAAPMLISSLMNHKKNAAAQAQQTGALKTSSDAMQGQSTLANTITNFAQGQTSMAQPALNKAMDYYMNAAGSGGRNSVNQAIAPDVARINDTYAGAESGINARVAPGGARDQALADLYKQRAGQISMTGVNARTNAVGSLADMGQKGMATASGAYGQAGNILSNLGGQYSSLQNNQFNQQQTKNQNWQNMGAMFAKIIGGGMNKDANSDNGDGSGGGFNWKNF